MILDTDTIKNHQNNYSGTIKQRSRPQNTKVSRNQTRMKIRNRKKHRNNHKQVSKRKINREKERDTDVASLEIFCQTLLTLNLPQNINGH